MPDTHGDYDRIASTYDERDKADREGVAAGLRRIESALVEAEEAGEALVFPDDLSLRHAHRPQGLESAPPRPQRTPRGLWSPASVAHPIGVPRSQ